MSEEYNPVVEWDLNDPSLSEYRPDIAMDEIPKQLRSAPPPDGYHWVRARLGNRDSGPVYIKGLKGPGGKILDGKVVAWVDCRVYNREEGTEGGFLKTWYPTTIVMKGSKGSQLTAICYLAGKPLKSGDLLLDIKNHVERVFAEAGEDGILLLVKTRWIKSVPKVDANGMPIYKDGTEFKDYDEIRGELKIKKLMAAQGVHEDLAHLFIDPVSGDERSCYAEIVSLEDPSKFEEA